MTDRLHRLAPEGAGAAPPSETLTAPLTTVPPRLRPAGGRVPASLRAAGLAIAVLVAVPILVVVAATLFPDSGTRAHIVEVLLPRYVTNTVLLVLAVGILAGGLGIGGAWLTTMCRFPGQRFFVWALVLPFAVPGYLMAYTYTDLLESYGPVQAALRDATGLRFGEYWFPGIRTLEGAAVMLGFVLYPYVYLSTRAGLLAQSGTMLDVARALGAGPWRLFGKVALPVLRPAIVAGLALALMETLADFGTVSYFGVQTFTTGIYRAWFSYGEPVVAAQLSTALLSAVILVLLLERLSRGRRHFAAGARRQTPLPCYRLHGLRAAAAIIACLLPLAIGFVIPAARLLYLSVMDGDAQFGRRYLELVGNSLLLGAVAAPLAVAAAVVVAALARMHSSRTTRAAAGMAGLGYAIPGSVIAVGILLPFAAIDRGLNALATGLLDWQPGLVLTGGIAGLVAAYLVRFLAAAQHSLAGGFGRLSPSVDAAARTLGVRPWGVIRRIHLPLLRPALLAGLLIVFVDVIKELPATLILRPFNFDTLAIQAYNLASDERLGEASTAALTIVAVGLLPVILLTRSMARSED
ncbi:ABC transporter permease [Marinibaculum pumilum]|uniref:ABC transporter permease n=1 Tax=Marinibaculum pumilum TaxID=1766165 RepID=A0ABV7L9C2_9PROT